MRHKSVQFAQPSTGASATGEFTESPCGDDSPVDFDEMQVVESILQESPILFEKISAALGCHREGVPLAVREVVRFLWLAANHHQGQLTPSRRVDLAWHEFLLCTRAYQQFCMAHFGRMIHHEPGGPAAQHRQQFHMTLRCYRKRFGIPEITYWGGPQIAAAECGSCEAVLSRSTF
jgi:hypothetical protein